MKTFDFGEYGMIEALNSTISEDSADSWHGDYVLLSEAQAKIDALTDVRDELLAAVKNSFDLMDAAGMLDHEGRAAYQRAIKRGGQE